MTAPGSGAIRVEYGSQAVEGPCGEAGGEIVATGTPEQVAAVEESFTGQFLRELLPAHAAAAA